MKLSKRGEYALRSLINLGIAAEVHRPLVRVTLHPRLHPMEGIIQQLFPDYTI